MSGTEALEQNQKHTGTHTGAHLHTPTHAPTCIHAPTLPTHKHGGTHIPLAQESWIEMAGHGEVGTACTFEHSKVH